MIDGERLRIAEQLALTGHTVTTAERLEIANFEALAQDLADVVASNEQLDPESDAWVEGMIMCKDSVTKAAGSRLVQPILEVLFVDDDEASQKWDMYTINRYETGDFFSPHQDYLEEGTVMIITAQGTRELDVYKKEDEDDVFIEVDATYPLPTGSILLLDAARDLGHAARCTQGPSISVVGDLSLSLI